MKKSDDILERAGLSPSERAVYLALLEGASGVKEIMKISSEKRPTVYYALNSLEAKGLVSKTGKDHAGSFQVEPIEKLSVLIEDRIAKEKALLADIGMFAVSYLKKKQSSKVRVSYFDTVQSIRSAIMYTVYATSKHIRSIVPADNFFAEIGLSFINEYVDEKNARGIKTMALWEDIPNKKILQDKYNGSSIRQLPVSMHGAFKTTVFVYDDRTLYISPQKESFAVLIESEEHARLMRAMFDVVWDAGFPVSLESQKKEIGS